jgi:hypothetical protein
VADLRGEKPFASAFFFIFIYVQNSDPYRISGEKNAVGSLSLKPVLFRISL